MLLALFAGVDWVTIRIMLVIMVLSLVVFALRSYLWDLRQRFRARHWTKTTATVTAPWIDREHGPQGITFMRVTVPYTYIVVTVQTGSYTFLRNTQAEAEPLAAALQGAAFTICYNPRKVESSVVLLKDRPDRALRRG